MSDEYSENIDDRELNTSQVVRNVSEEVACGLRLEK